MQIKWNHDFLGSQCGNFSAQLMSWIVEKQLRKKKKKSGLELYAAWQVLRAPRPKGGQSPQVKKPSGESAQEVGCHDRPGLLCLPHGFMEFFKELIPTTQCLDQRKHSIHTSYCCWFSSINILSTVPRAG